MNNTPNSSPYLEYLSQTTPTQRRQQVQRICAKYPGRVPVLIQCDYGIQKMKYIVPSNITVSEFMIAARKHMDTLHANEALFAMVGGGEMLTGSQLMSQIYANYRDPEDLFLKIHILREATFG